MDSNVRLLLYSPVGRLFGLSVIISYKGGKFYFHAPIRQSLERVPCSSSANDFFHHSHTYSNTYQFRPLPLQHDPALPIITPTHSQTHPYPVHPVTPATWPCIANSSRLHIACLRLLSLSKALLSLFSGSQVNSWMSSRVMSTSRSRPRYSGTL